MLSVNEFESKILFPNIKFESKYIFYLILSRFYVFSSIWLLFLYSLGYSLQEVLLFNFVTLGITITLEIPAGFMAEKIGHKQTLLIAYAIYFMSVAILLFNTGLTILFISNCLWGIGSSLSTDTEDIWLYNQLLAENKYDKALTESIFSNLYAKFVFLGFISTGIAELVGSICYNISVSIPFLLSAGVMLITIYWIQIVPAVPYTVENKLHKEKVNYTEQLRELVKLNVFQLIIGFIILNSILFNVVVWFPNYLISISVNSSTISTAIGTGTFITGLGILLSSKFLTGKKTDQIIKIILIAIPILLLNLALQTNLILIITILIIQAIYGSLIPYYRVKIIVNLPNERKQVYLSIIGVISLSIYIFIDVLTGVLVTFISFILYFQLVSIFLALIIIPIIIHSLHREQKHEITEKYY